MRKISNRNYHKLLSSGRWRELRRRYLSDHPICQRCESLGKTTLATCVHHILPVESQVTPYEMERVAYDYTNLEALCDACHEERHKHCNRRCSKNETRAAAKEIAQAFISRWKIGGE